MGRKKLASFIFIGFLTVTLLLNYYHDDASKSHDANIKVKLLMESIKRNANQAAGTRAPKDGSKIQNVCYVSPSRDAASYNCSANPGYPPFDINDKKFREARPYTEGVLKLNSCANRSEDEVPDVPVIVTGFSSNHYMEGIALLKNLMQIIVPKTNNTKIIIYNIGFSKKNYQDLKAFLKKTQCHICIVRDFPFHLFPQHVSNLHGFQWKTLIIAMTLLEFPFVTWMDTSIRLKPNIFALFDKTKACHIQLCRYEKNKQIASIAHQTGDSTMNFLNQNPHDYLSRGVTQGGWGVYLRTQIVMERVIRPWVTCALTYGCMVTDRDRIQGECRKPRTKSLSWCHRFDQSVLAMIVSNVFPNYWTQNAFSDGQYGTVFRG